MLSFFGRFFGRKKSLVNHPVTGATAGTSGHSIKSKAVSGRPGTALSQQMQTRPKTVPGTSRTMREPREDELQSILGYSGDVVTSENGDIHLTSQQRRVAAALKNGTLLVAKSEYASAMVSSVKETLIRSEYKPSQIFLVDLEVIRNVYENAARRTGTEIEGTTTARMQRTVVDLIRHAAALKCSDIHITVDRHEAMIRVRSDGVMMDLRDLQAPAAMDLLQAAFYMADASDAQYKIFDYQGARISSASKFALPEGVQAVRLQFNPLPDGGRYMVARLLYQQRILGNQDVDSLGYSDHQISQIKKMREKPHGIVIISGPTGSGKSTTLQTALQATAREKNYEVNIITVEDPPEYLIKGAAQLPVLNVKTEEERHEAFRAAITASLRSDPDIIMIGEIRDPASAGLAFQAAMTGHQVWASLHANDAASILDRLKDNKVESYKLTDSSLVVGLIGQRLVRRLCDACKIPLEKAVRSGVVTEEMADLVISALPEHHKGVHVANPNGCTACGGRGNKGRTVVAETILPDTKYMDFIAREKKFDAIEYWRDKLFGMTMLEHAAIKMVTGQVDPREVASKVAPLDGLTAERMQKVLAMESHSGISPNQNTEELPSSDPEG